MVTLFMGYSFYYNILAGARVGAMGLKGGTGRGRRPSGGDRRGSDWHAKRVGGLP